MVLVANGDVSALGELYDLYSDDVRRVVHRLTGGASDVEDIVHATFLELPKIAAGYDGRASCRSWLCGIASKLVLRWRRSFSRAARRLIEFRSLQDLSETATPESAVLDRERLHVLERGIAALSARKREVFVLVEVEAMSADEVAVVLGIPAATVRTRLFHAKRELREALNRGGR